MTKAPACPDITQFKKLATGQLGPADKESLLEHLEGCQACAQRLESLSEKDTLADLIRQAGTVGEGPPGETIARLIEQVRDLRPGPEPGDQVPAQIRIVCTGCGKSLKVKAALAGKKVKCPHCQAVVPVPGAPQPGSGQRPPGPDVAEALTMAPGSLAGAGNPAATAAEEPRSPQPAGADPHLYDFLAPAQAPDELGRLGPYRILRVLGAGGMGVVFQAEDPQLQRLVALEAMLPSLAASESAKQRFLREARAAAKLKHDHIVTIHQVGEDRGAPYLAMEFLEGEPLDDRLKRQGKLPLTAVLRIGREIAEGLAAAHERGLIHRDIKPANVWLEGKKARAKILDFGLARTTTDEAQLTQSGAIVGTPAYMAPEQGKGKNVDHRCDLFSLGCVLYRMATGEAPFHGDDMISTLMAVATENPAPPVSLNLDLPTELSDLIMQLLAKKPADRPESAQAVADTLKRLAREQQSAPPVKVQEKAKTPAVRSGRNVRRIAVASLAVVLLIPLGWWLSGIIVRVESEKGTLTIESDDPTVLVTVTADGGAKLQLGMDKREIHLKPGKYGIELTEAKTGLKLSTSQFTIMSGGKETVKVLWEKKDAPARTSETAPTYKNSLGMEFILVPKGKSWLGGGGGKPGDKEVEIKEDFYLGKYEVTQEEWEKVTGKNPCHFSRTGGGKDPVKDIADADLKCFPVESVTWNDARLFVELLNKREKEAGWVYRLPKEAEWEYACRGGPMTDKSESAFDFYFEKPTNQLLPDQANCEHGKELKRTCKVGAYKPNRLGLYDMHGNVYEWCDDTEKTADGALQGVRRGGGWLHAFWSCTAAYRLLTPPSFWDHTLGLRLARVPVGKELVAKPPEEKKTETPPLGPLTGSMVQKFEGHGGAIHGVAMSGDGTLVLTGSEGKTAILWEAATGKKLHTFQGHVDRIWHVALSRDRKYVLTGSADGIAILWEAATGKKIQNFHTGEVSSVALSRDGKHVVTGSFDKTAILWEAATGKKIQTFLGHSGSVISVDLSGDGTLVLTGSDDTTAILWEAATGKKMQTFQGHTARVISVALSGDGTLVLTGSRDKTAVLWNAASGKKLQSFLGHTDYVPTVALSGDGRRVLTGSKDKTAILWDAATGKKIQIFEGHTAQVEGVALSSDGKLVLTGSEDKTAILWDVKASAPSGVGAKFTNSLGMEFVLVPRGKSWLGGGGGKPGEEVDISYDFYLGKYEVMQEEWEKVMGRNPSIFRGAGDGRFPVENVSWITCQEFVVRLNERVKESGWVYRLPSEVEWEYACRGGPMTDRSESAFSYYFEKPTNQLPAAPVQGNAGGWPAYPPNRLGLYDMHGKVWEWCADELAPMKHPAGAVTRVARGGNPAPAARRSPAFPHGADQAGGLRLARVPVAHANLPQAVNSLGMEFVLVPRGKSWLGGGGGKPGEKEVKIKENFYLGKYEVTQEEWEKVTGSNPSHFQAVAGVAKEDMKRFPVEQVSWDDCQLFIERLNKQAKEAGWVYRLPKEAEWEYACRGGPMTDKSESAFDFYFEKPTNQLLPDRANFWEGNSPRRTCKVGAYKPNRLGLYDMHGNAWEWCDDDVKDDKAGTLRVFRSGGWGDGAVNWTAARRSLFSASLRDGFLGLRVARVPIGKEVVAKTPPSPAVELQVLHRENIPLEALQWAGAGDASKAPASLVAVLGEATPIHTQPIRLAFSPDSRWLATGSADHTLFLREADTGKIRRVLKGHSGTVSSVAFPRDGKTLVSASQDGTLKLWPTENAADPQTIQPKLGEIWAMAVSPDGRFLAAGGAGGGIKLWRWGQWEAAVDVATAGAKVTALAFSPNGEMLAAGALEQKPACPIRLFNTADGKPARSWTAHEQEIIVLTFSQDGKYLASTGGGANSLKVWDLASTSKPVFEMGNYTGFYPAAFSPDGKTVLGGLAGMVCLFDFTAAKPTGGWPGFGSKEPPPGSLGYRGHLRAVAYSPDGKRLAIGTSTGQVQLWDAATWQAIPPGGGHDHHAQAVAVSPDGRTLLSTGDDFTLRRWDLAKPGQNKVVHQFDRAPHGLSFSPDGKKYATAASFEWYDTARRGEVWDTATDKRLFSVDRPGQNLPGLVFSPDGGTLAGCEQGGSECIVLWDANTGKQVHRFPKTGLCADHPAFSRDGKRVAVATYNTKAVKVWDVASGDEIASWTDDRPMHAVALSPDGLLLAAGHQDGAISLWDVTEKGKKKRVWEGHSGRITRLAFTPDGKTVISACVDGTIRLWNPEHQRAKEIITLCPANRPLTFDLDPSGKYLFAAGHGPMIYVLRLAIADTQGGPATTPKTGK